MLKICLFAAALGFAACSKSEPSSTSAPAPSAPPVSAKRSRDPAAAKQMIAQGATVLDVRTPEEYADAHLPNATNVPVEDIGGRMADVAKLVGGDKTKPIVVYCASGSRAATAKTALEQAGYSHVVNGGGLDDLR